MTTFHVTVDPVAPQRTSLWWRRTLRPDTEGAWYWQHIERYPDPWWMSIGICDGLDMELPIDGFVLTRRSDILEGMHLPITVKIDPPPWLDILAPFPPSIKGWAPLGRTGDHEWPGVGEYRDGYRGITHRSWGIYPGRKIFNR